MKWTLIILTLFLSCCSDRQQSKQKTPIQTDTLILESKAFKCDSIVARDYECQDLSFAYNYTIKFKRFYNIDGIHDSCLVHIIISDKKTQKQIDSLGLSSIYYYKNVFENCDNTRAYITKKNRSKEILDNDFGDLIIADLNFDSKEDIAVINDCANSGMLYNYYIQDNFRKFKLDSFLTDSMIYFPSEINKNNKTLLTRLTAGVCGLGEHKFRLNQETHKWSEISHKIINICK